MLYHRIDIVEIYLRLHRIGFSRDLEFTYASKDSYRRNILVREDGRPCIIDFTRAKLHKCHIRDYPWLTTQLRYAPELSCDELQNIIHETEVYERGALNPIAVALDH